MTSDEKLWVQKATDWLLELQRDLDEIAQLRGMQPETTTRANQAHRKLWRALQELRKLV